MTRHFTFVLLALNVHVLAQVPDAGILGSESYDFIEVSQGPDDPLYDSLRVDTELTVTSPEQIQELLLDYGKQFKQKEYTQTYTYAEREGQAYLIGEQGWFPIKDGKVQLGYMTSRGEKPKYVTVRLKDKQGREKPPKEKPIKERKK